MQSSLLASLKYECNFMVGITFIIDNISSKRSRANTLKKLNAQ